MSSINVKGCERRRRLHVWDSAEVKADKNETSCLPRRTNSTTCSSRMKFTGL